MTWLRRAFAGVLLTLLATVPATLHADTVQLSLHDGRVSLVATNATPAQIFEAWSRAGGVLFVNAERVPGTPITVTLEDVPEEQALDTLLRPVSGYLARRRVSGTESGSIFDRIVILATPSVARETSPAPPPSATPARPGPAAPVFPQPPRVVGAQPMPQPGQGTPATGASPVGRIIGADGQPVEDDQVGAPPPPYTPPPPYSSGDAPDGRSPGAPPRATPGSVPPQQPQQPQPLPPSTSAPVGVPRPGMPVPTPQPAQPR